jgi:hypothetical protein
MKGLRLAEAFEAPAVCGGKPLGSRPAGSKLLAAAKKGKTLVIVAKLDRLFRSVADAANVIADFDRKGIQLVAIQEGFDMSSRRRKHLTYPHSRACLLFLSRCSGRRTRAQMLPLDSAAEKEGPTVGPSLPQNRC